MCYDTTCGEWTIDETANSPDAEPTILDPMELPESAQRWNSLVFIVNNSISYLVAPVFYVGILHAAILSALGFSDKTANLPESVSMWMTPIPVLIAWIWPSKRLLRPMLVINYVCKGSAGLLAAALFFAAPEWLAIGLTAHAGVIGITNGVTNMCLWDLIGRGMTPKRRAWTLGLTYGVAPAFAVLGSFASQFILGESLTPSGDGPISDPIPFVILFGVTGPAMAICLACVFLAVMPSDESEEPQVGFSHVREGLRLYFADKVMLIAIFGFLLTSAGGNMIMNNVALMVRDKLGESAKVQYTGIQLVLRFGCKSLFGFTLGLMLSRFQAKVPALATTLFCMAGVLWAMFVPGKWYLFSLGLLGAGELFYVYYLNYIVACSAPERIRENTAYTNLLLFVVSFMPLIYGAISDKYKIDASLKLSLVILLVTVALVGTLLPRQPVPYSARVRRP